MTMNKSMLYVSENMLAINSSEQWARIFVEKTRHIDNSSVDFEEEVHKGVQYLSANVAELNGASDVEKQAFLFVLRGLRNVAALASNLLEVSETLPSIIVNVIDAIARISISSHEGSVSSQAYMRVTVQLLANIANAERLQSMTFQACWPDSFFKVVMVDARDAQDAACQALYNFCRLNTERALQVSSTGGRFFLHLLNSCHLLQHEPTNATLALLLGHLCLRCGNLGTLMVSMSNVLSTSTIDCEATDDQSGRSLLDGALDGAQAHHQLGLLVQSPAAVALLHMLAHEIAICPGLTAVDSCITASFHQSDGLLRVLGSLLEVMDAAFVVSAQAMKDEAIDEQTTEKMTDCASSRYFAGSHALEAVLRLLALILSHDEATNGQSATRSILTSHFGLHQTLLSALASLPHLFQPKNVSISSPERVSHSFKGFGQSTTNFPSNPPYPCFRADLLAVVGNLAFSHRESQNNIAADGGIELILSQCHFCPSEPLVREWALWTVRNLCVGNEDVQAHVKSLQVDTVVQDEALRKRNQTIELDAITGKLKLVDLNK